MTTTSAEAPPGADRTPGRLRRLYDKHWYAYAMVIPTVLVLGVLVLFPLVQGVYQSFTNLVEVDVQTLAHTVLDTTKDHALLFQGMALIDDQAELCHSDVHGAGTRPGVTRAWQPLR